MDVDVYFYTQIHGDCAPAEAEDRRWDRAGRHLRDLADVGCDCASQSHLRKHVHHRVLSGLARHMLPRVARWKLRTHRLLVRLAPTLFV